MDDDAMTRRAIRVNGFVVVRDAVTIRAVTRRIMSDESIASCNACRGEKIEIQKKIEMIGAS
jgi:hypothetical protein